MILLIFNQTTRSIQIHNNITQKTKKVKCRVNKIQKFIVLCSKINWLNVTIIQKIFENIYERHYYFFQKVERVFTTFSKRFSIIQKTSRKFNFNQVFFKIFTYYIFESKNKQFEIIHYNEKNNRYHFISIFNFILWIEIFFQFY